MSDIYCTVARQSRFILHAAVGPAPTFGAAAGPLNRISRGHDHGHRLSTRRAGMTRISSKTGLPRGVYLHVKVRFGSWVRHAATATPQLGARARARAARGGEAKGNNCYCVRQLLLGLRAVPLVVNLFQRYARNRRVRVHVHVRAHKIKVAAAPAAELLAHAHVHMRAPARL